MIISTAGTVYLKENTKYFPEDVFIMKETITLDTLVNNKIIHYQI